jgi:hypothetical protein
MLEAIKCFAFENNKQEISERKPDDGLFSAMQLIVARSFLWFEAPSEPIVIRNTNSE